MSNVLTIEQMMTPDQLGCHISNNYITWESDRTHWVKEKEEVLRYVFATDTTKTSNSKLPWSNKTTIPKLCQIRDNISANYMMSLFPKRKWLIWEGNTKSDEDIKKKLAIEQYMAWLIDRTEFYEEMEKIVLDYIDYGNCFATVEWVDQTNLIQDNPDSLVSTKQQVGFVGPMVRRISPLDIVFNPAARDFASTPKIIRSVVSLGELKEILNRQSITPEDREDAEELYNYLKELRSYASQLAPDNSVVRDAIYQISGFDNFRDYLDSNYVEILTFYGDIYDVESDTLLKNYVIKVVDRHKVFSKRPNGSFFGTAPIWHAGWRVRPDNLWAAGPLDNLVGMQYRLDHLENMKADVFDLIAYPPLAITGYVDDFEWGPFEKIYLGDEGKIDVLSPDVQALQADTQIAILEQKMEEMAGSPKEAMGFRTPGEKTKYEVQRLENASARIYQNKINHIERQVVETCLNGMLELAKRNLSAATVRVFDDELKIARFNSLTAQDITGNGRLRPIAARHFAEQAQMIQDLTEFYQSAAGSDPELRAHFSSIGLARLYESLLSLEDYKIVQPFIRLSEQADAQRLMNSHQENVSMEAMTPSGLSEGDYDLDMMEGGLEGNMAGGVPSGAPSGPGAGNPAGGTISPSGPSQGNPGASAQGTPSY